MTIAPVHQPCLICKSTSREIVQTQSLALLNKQAPCEVHFGVCHSCGHLQQWPPVPPDLMAYHYRTFASYELFGDPEKLRDAPPSRHAKRFLSLTHNIGIAPGRAYEIGCASGEMLNQFRREGWKVQGCDLSPSAAAQARAFFGITVDECGEEEALTRHRDIDLILACHVLEHLYDPTETLGRFAEALAPNGYLLLEVPCAIAPESLPPGWFTFEHLHYYRQAILDRLLRRAGFEPVEMRIALTAEDYPVITLAARKTGRRVDIQSYPEASIAMARQYAARDTALWAATAEKLASIRGTAFLYGAGIHTAQLLDHSRLAERIEIIAIADRDPKKWGQSLAGRTVISPEALFRDPGDAPVIISSYGSERAIVDGLLEGGIARSRIKPLYASLPASP
jgi:SAM-dependent methyltransferase